MSIDQLTQLEENFAKNLQIIREQSRELPKAQKLRITAWLKKLCSVVDNVFWRKNRNLYTQVLAIMLTAQTLAPPFDKSPPDTSLPRLTLYQIPFWIREKLDQTNNLASFKNAQQRKENISRLANINPCNQFSHIHDKSQKAENSANMRLRKRDSVKLKSMQATSIPSNLKQLQIRDFKQRSSFEEENKQTERRSCHSKSLAKHKNREIIETVKKTLYFLAKNNQNFEGDPLFRKIIKQMVQFGDAVNADFRNMKFSIIDV